MEKFTISDCAVRARSKKEVYSLLVTQGNLFLPPIEECNHEFIKQIVQGKKLYIKGCDAKVRQVPMTRELTVDKILIFARRNSSIDSYLPELKSKYPNRSWLCTVVNTLIEKKFVEFIADKLKEREKHIVNLKKLEVTAVPEIAILFKNSSMRSHENGKFYQYIRSERKRTYKQIENDNDLKDEKIAELIKAKSDLESQMRSMENEIEFYRHVGDDHEEHKEQNRAINDHYGDDPDPDDMR